MATKLGRCNTAYPRQIYVQGLSTEGWKVDRADPGKNAVRKMSLLAVLHYELFFNKSYSQSCHLYLVKKLSLLSHEDTIRVGR